MIREAIARYRDRIDPVSTVVTVGVGGVLVWLGADVNFIGTILGAVVVAPLAEPILERFDIGPGVVEVAFGAFAVVAGIVRLRAGGYWFGGSMLAIGCWICLDGMYAWRTGDGTARDEDEMTKDEVLLVGQQNRWLPETLWDADQTLTRAEICDRTGLLEDDLDRLIEIHGESGPIERVGNAYVIDCLHQEGRTGGRKPSHPTVSTGPASG